MRMTSGEKAKFEEMIKLHARDETARLIRQMSAVVTKSDREKIELFMRVFMHDALTLLDSAVGKAVQP